MPLPAPIRRIPPGLAAAIAPVFPEIEHITVIDDSGRTLVRRGDDAVFVLTGGELSHTTGLHVPVDAGVAAAFLR